MIAATRHDEFAGADYRLAAGLGLRTLRDGLRWHRIDRNNGFFDWSSFLPALRAARSARVEIIWDLFHYGWPDGLDIWSTAFVDRFASFARRAAQIVKDESDGVPFFAPVNEISFVGYAGGQFAIFEPFARDRGDELKRQLVRACIAAMEAVWDVEPRARMVHVDPTINVVPDAARPATVDAAERMTAAQYAAWDMLCGIDHPELGGAPRYLDVIGMNYYCHNQWVEGGDPVERRDPAYRPFRALLRDNFRRYRRPLFISETGIEGDHRAEWFAYVCDEVAAALDEQIPVHGIALYPIMNHPGWEDDRHCPNGLIDYRRDTFERSVYFPLAAELKRQQKRFALRAGQPEAAAVGNEGPYEALPVRTAARERSR